MVAKTCFKVINELLADDRHAVKATQYLSDTLVVKATRRRFKGKINKRERSKEIYLTVGKPNFAEARFIKKHIRAGGKFPLKKPQVKRIA